MRHVAVMLAGFLLGAGVAGIASAREWGIEELPADILGVATEPIRSVAKQTRQFDPISGLWFGLLEGSLKSLERATGLVVAQPEEGGSQQSKQPLPEDPF